MKRIFGKIAVDEDYVPQQATFEALVKYGGYTPHPSDHPEYRPKEMPPVPVNKFRYRQKYLIGFLVLIVSFAVAGIFGWLHFHKNDPGPAKIKVASMEGILPSTVFFELQVPELTDSVFINFGDKSRIIYTKPGAVNISHSYLFPGVFTAYLQTRAGRIAESQVSIRSDKWIGLAFHRQNDLPNHYFEIPALRSGPDSIFNITSEQLNKMGLDTTSLTFTRLANYTATKGLTDGFIFETTFKNLLRKKGIYCNNTKIHLAGIDGQIRFTLISAGCSSKGLNVISEKRYEGKSHNLSRFVIDQEKWNHVRLIDHNKQVTLYVNDKLLYSGTYTKSLGEFKGLYIEFEGNGFVKNCELKTLSGKPVYHF
ncbi:hypothetical protein KXQ82_04620 [Mucilaginibacter sp. HMF5004]|uniref:hypothetical protein n=1 Tax=Mucilaginibacter rivuli TaxID=2857527 RepID=UPI001C5CF268|nr:hypothetical protein [Mucilaginibacter rivuli]MBW4888982.1 hypothetical protein [Mucilaginibacter rivuli]